MEAFLPALTAMWLGILTSISPCPLATNIAAVSYIGKRVASPRKVAMAGALYTAGRSLAYVALGSLLVYGLVSAPYVSNFLQTYMNKILGPVLIVVGMFLLGLIQFGFARRAPGEHIQKSAEGMGMFGALVLGAAFALTFCPVSAALFFGSLLPLAVTHESPVLMPLVYGVGTALPVVLFTVMIAVGTKSLSRVLAGVGRVERWARRVTGTVFIAVGVYLTLVYIFGLPL